MSSFLANPQFLAILAEQKYLAVPKASTASGVWAAIAVVLMLLVSLSIGIWARRQWATFDEYMVGHRTFGPVATGAAVAAAYLSGWAYCGSAGVVYKVGWSGMWFAGVFTLVGIMPCIWFTARRTRELSATLGATTLPELIGRRFESKAVQTIVGLSMLFFLTLYSIGQLKAAGATWYVVTGFPIWICLLLAVFITWLYMMLGGYTSTQMAMAFQGAFLGAVGLVLGVWAMIKIGGPAALNAKLAAQNPALVKLIRPELPHVGKLALFSTYSGIIAAPVIFFTMAIGFPHNVSRFLGMKKLTSRDFWILCISAFCVAGIPIMIDCGWNGNLSRALFGPQLLKIKPWGADLANPMLAWGVGGIPLVSFYTAALMAAALSTLSAMVFIMSGNIVRDLIKLWWPQTSDKAAIATLRVLFAVFLLIPFVFTYLKPPPLLAIFMGFAAIGLGATYFFVTAISYYWKGATKWGVIACVVYGTIGTGYTAIQVAHKKIGMGTMEWYMLAGCAICYFVGSWITRKPSEETLAKCFPE
ncbi:MAG: hypothetical protein JRI44_06040 [Deltaproteobacteria bacterium]|nr:hypothetical protein [Deltaproteobacteria bacterium]